MWALARYRGREVIFVCAAAVKVEWDNVLYLLDRLEGAASFADDAVRGALAALDGELLVADQVHASARIKAHEPVSSRIVSRVDADKGDAVVLLEL